MASSASLTPQQRALFQGKNFVSIATIGKDGGPRNTIIWVDMDGDDVIVNGAASRGWVKNLRRNPNVALTIYDHENPYHRVTVIGKATEITTNGGNESIDRLSMKYGGQPYPDKNPKDPRTLVRIQPEKVTAMGL